jgi:hypothetical protein
MLIGWAVRSAPEWLVELIEGGDGTRATVLGWKRAAPSRLGPSVSAAGDRKERAPCGQNFSAFRWHWEDG